MIAQPTPRGFTIIEVMLFLAITGLMLGGVLLGVGGSIDRQRYQDATASVEDFFRGQYNTVDNVYTNRPGSVACTSAGLSLTDSQPRGTSDCSVIGRYITTDDGKKLVSKPVYALTDVTKIDVSDFSQETAYIKALKLTTAGDSLSSDDEQFTVPWDSRIYTDKSSPASSNTLTMLLVKLPSNGLIRTFISQNANQSVEELIDHASGSGILVCVDPSGLVASPALGVTIAPLAANTSGVQPTTGQSGMCS